MHRTCSGALLRSTKIWGGAFPPIPVLGGCSGRRSATVMIAASRESRVPTASARRRSLQQNRRRNRATRPLLQSSRRRRGLLQSPPPSRRRGRPYALHRSRRRGPQTNRVGGPRPHRRRALRLDRRSGRAGARRRRPLHSPATPRPRRSSRPLRGPRRRRRDGQRRARRGGPRLDRRRRLRQDRRGARRPRRRRRAHSRMATLSRMDTRRTRQRPSAIATGRSTLTLSRAATHRSLRAKATRQVRGTAWATPACRAPRAATNARPPRTRARCLRPPRRSRRRRRPRRRRRRPRRPCACTPKTRGDWSPGATSAWEVAPSSSVRRRITRESSTVAMPSRAINRGWWRS
mmetsp:Transcript_1379/g.4096  ORF Transcript_1379/g.4096 Transcript_1379/m.4096 type:complete len:347 (+) Transcript_1379:1914-2954(+)